MHTTEKHTEDRQRTRTMNLRFDDRFDVSHSVVRRFVTFALCAWMCATYINSSIFSIFIIVWTNPMNIDSIVNWWNVSDTVTAPGREPHRNSEFIVDSVTTDTFANSASSRFCPIYCVLWPFKNKLLPDDSIHSIRSYVWLYGVCQLCPLCAECRVHDCTHGTVCLNRRLSFWIIMHFSTDSNKCFWLILFASPISSKSNTSSLIRTIRNGIVSHFSAQFEFVRGHRRRAVFYQVRHSSINGFRFPC